MIGKATFCYHEMKFGPSTQLLLQGVIDFPNLTYSKALEWLTQHRAAVAKYADDLRILMALPTTDPGNRDKCGIRCDDKPLLLRLSVFQPLGKRSQILPGIHIPAHAIQVFMCAQ
jgi:hypothetical protein